MAVCSVDQIVVAVRAWNADLRRQSAECLSNPGLKDRIAAAGPVVMTLHVILLILFAAIMQPRRLPFRYRQFRIQTILAAGGAACAAAELPDPAVRILPALESGALPASLPESDVMSVIPIPFVVMVVLVDLIMVCLPAHVPQARRHPLQLRALLSVDLASTAANAVPIRTAT